MWTVLKLALPAAAVISAALGSSAPALADCTNGVYDEPLPPIATITPAPNAAIEQSYVYPVHFTVTSPNHFVAFYIRVSSRPQLGQTGILSDLVGVDDTILTESATDPDYYFGQTSFTGSSLTTWTDVPGTYYWQLFGSWRDYSFACHAFAGPTNRITITPSPPAPPASPPAPPPNSPAAPAEPSVTLAQAARYAAGMVFAHTGRRPHIGLSCHSTNLHSLQCALWWTAGGSSYRAAGQFTRPAPRRAAYDVNGYRAWRSCIRPRHCSIRTTRFRWIGHF
jgi:hypothetical protein